MRRSLVALLVCSGCQFPPDAPHVGAGAQPPVTFDGGEDQGSLALLDGNQLQLDGGPPGGFAHLVFTISDGDTRLPTPARVIFRPPPGAGFADSITTGLPSPTSPGSATGAVVGPGVLGSVEGVLLVSGQGVVPVPPGTYGLFITRGPEYEAVETTITVAAGEVRAIGAQLDHSVDTRGWLAADMHVHVSRSGDSHLVAERRVVSEVSNGIEVIVNTDHNVNTDLSPYALALGYGGDTVGTLVGNEFNFNPGHGGAYPVPFDAADQNGGAPRYQDCALSPGAINCIAAADAFTLMHNQIPGQTVVTINHPFWPGGDLGYFSNIKWGAGTANPLPATLDTAGAFDALEILSGYQMRDPVLTPLVADWFYLIGTGTKVTALGNSDTHKLNWVRSGFPRTWLRLPNDRPGDTTGSLLSEAILKQRAIASSGPFITVTVDGAQIGDSLKPKTPGQVVIEVLVDAPNWITVDTVRVYVNGIEKHSFPVPAAGQRPVFKTSFTETLPSATEDAWVVAFASGATPLPPDVVGEYSHVNGWEMLPWAITNPVFIDADGDGRFRPPAPPTGGLGPASKRLLRFDGQVPVECDPSERLIGSEPPLDSILPPERQLMPLLYP